MRIASILWVAAVALAGAGRASAADAVAMSDDEAFAGAAAWKKGESRAAWIAVEGKVRDSRGDADRRKALSVRLAAILKGDAAVEAKDCALRELRVVCGPDAIPAIAPLLSDPTLSHMARYVLQSLREFPAAAAAHREALGKAEGAMQLGLIESLGEIRDGGAVPALAKLLDGDDAARAEAAAAALGKIAAPDCVEPLKVARVKALAAEKPLITNAMLQCAERLVADGKASAAAPVYEALFKEGEPPHVRVAALRGLSLAKGDDGAAFLVQQLSGGDPGLQPHAAHFLMRLPDETVARGVAAELSRATAPSARVALLAVLEGKRTPAARGAALAQLKEPGAEVQKASLRVLATAGTAEDVPVLCASMQAAEAETAEQAERTLSGLSSDGVHAAIRGQIEASEAAMKVRLVRVLGIRKASDSVEALLGCARDADAPVRTAAYVAIGQVGAADVLPKLAALLAAPQAEGDRDPAEKAIFAISDREEACAAQIPAMLSAVEKAPVAARFVVFRLAAKLGGDASLRAVRAALKDADPSIRDAAVRALAQWNDASAADDLLGLLKTTSDKGQKAVLLSGIVRMTGLADDRSPAQRLALCQAALAAAETPEQKGLALATFGPVKTLDALKAVLPYLDDASLKDAAAKAVVAVASGLMSAYPDEAEQALRKAQAVSKLKEVHDAANGALYAKEKFGDFLIHWLVSGPYADGGKDCTQLFDTVFAPEKDPAKAKWTGAGGTDWMINFQKIFPGDNRVAYLKTNVWVPQDTDARLEMGSDDGIRVWINGKLVHGNNAVRGLQQGSDKQDVRLTKGWNTVMAKVTQGGGDWSACVKVVARDGKRVEGMRVNPWETPAIR